MSGERLRSVLGNVFAGGAGITPSAVRSWSACAAKPSCTGAGGWDRRCSGGSWTARASDEVRNRAATTAHKVRRDGRRQRVRLTRSTRRKIRVTFMGGWENEVPVANLGADYARTEALLTLVLT